MAKKKATEGQKQASWELIKHMAEEAKHECVRKCGECVWCVAYLIVNGKGPKPS